jgi:hypothetical protein
MGGYFYAATDGTVRWDGVPLSELDRSRVFDQIALMRQGNPVSLNSPPPGAGCNHSRSAAAQYPVPVG